MEMLLEKKPTVKKIIFHDASPKISAEVSVAFCRALNKRRPFCSKDTVSAYFIADKHQDVR
jgi:hypothetical protein